ncbi:FAD binding domain-containing protein [Seiridium cupressi]
MRGLVQLSALILAFLQPLVAGLAVPHYFQPARFTRRDLSVAQVQQELGATVSNGSTIFGPEDPRFPNATERYSTHDIPDIEVVVVPATEADIPIIYRVFAINRGHARTYSVGTFKGLMIDLGALLNIELQPDPKTAGLVANKNFANAPVYLLILMQATGSCDCVGMMDPGLGGGHGRHEGLYGMISDNIVQLNVVLANGTAIRVNETNHPDLLWDMKGAGHNFGIVTRFELKVWPREVELWHYHNCVWTEDKLEALFEESNKLHKDGNTPANMALNFNSFALNTSISEDRAVIFWSFAYRGPADEAEEILAGFNAIEPVYDVMGDVSYPEISEVQTTAIDTPTCVGNEPVTSMSETA